MSDLDAGTPELEVLRVSFTQKPLERREKPPKCIADLAICEVDISTRSRLIDHRVDPSLETLGSLVLCVVTEPSQK